MKRLVELEYVSVAEIKARLSEKIHSADIRGRRFAITSHGRPKAVLMSYKDYQALAQGVSEIPAQTIAITSWEREAPKRKRIIDSVASLFDEKKLTRKGQKGYKNEVLRKMERSR